MYVVPKEGFKIRDPQRRDTLPVEGREVEASSYWYALARDGDVTEGQPVPAAAEPEPVAKVEAVKVAPVVKPVVSQPYDAPAEVAGK